MGVDVGLARAASAPPVDDLQAYLDSVETLGGKIVQGITTIPGMVTMALFADPEGNVIGLAHSETPPS